MTAVPTLVIYRPKQGSEDALRELVQRHWPTIQALGLTTAVEPQLWTATDKQSGRAFFIELFEWKDENASQVAHETPEVMALWEPMGKHLETIEISKVEPLASIDAAN
jgi:hypothetical protein